MMMRKQPKQSRALATVAAVLEATEQLIEKNGVAALTTNAVAVRAGVSIGSLYQYFPNKESLLSRLGERYLDAERDVLKAAITKLNTSALGASLRSALSELVDAQRRFSETHKQVVRSLAIADPGQLSAQQQYEANEWRSVLDQIGAGMVAAVDGTLIATLVRGVAQELAHAEDDATRRSTIDRVVGWIEQLVASSPGTDSKLRLSA